MSDQSTRARRHFPASVAMSRRRRGRHGVRDTFLVAVLLAFAVLSAVAWLIAHVLIRRAGDHRGSVMTEILEVPWGRIQARDFARDFAARIRSGDPAEVTVLCRNSTETRWFQELAGPSTAICLLTGREPKTGEHTEKESAMTETDLKAVTIRDVPEEVRTRARWLAAVRGTSMNQVLVDALVSGLPTREQILTEAGETS